MKYKVGVALRNVEGHVITDDLRIEFRTPKRKVGEVATRFAGRRRVFELETRQLEWPIFCRVIPALYRGRRSPFTGFTQQQEIDVTLIRRSIDQYARVLPESGTQTKGLIHAAGVFHGNSLRQPPLVGQGLAAEYL